MKLTTVLSSFVLLLVAACASAGSAVTNGRQAAAACQLPVYSRIAPAQGANLIGGLISQPGGRYAADPSSSLMAVPSSGLYRTVVRPILTGEGQATYDRAVRRWVPVRPDWLAPDGSRYAYVDVNYQRTPLTATIHVVDVRKGADRVVLSGAYDISAFGSDGIYVVRHAPQADETEGLYRLDPQSGRLTTLASSGTWSEMGGAGWAAILPAGDPRSPGMPGTGDELLRLDLVTGRTQTWFHQPGSVVRALGTIGSQVLVGTWNNQASQIWLVSSPSSAVRVSNDPAQPTFEATVTDNHGAWVMSEAAVYRLNGRQLKKVADNPFKTSNDGVLAGPCVTGVSPTNIGQG